MLARWFASRSVRRPARLGRKQRRSLSVETLAHRRLMAAHPWNAEGEADVLLNYCQPEPADSSWVAGFAAEGENPGTGSPDQGPQEPGGNEPPGQPPRSALGIDLDTDSDHTGKIERSEVEDSIEWRGVGRAVQANLDDDNGNGVQDYLDAPFLDESGAPMKDDELVQAILSIDDHGVDLDGYSVSLGPRYAGVNLWATPDKQPLQDRYVIGKDAIPKEIWVEGRADSISTMVIVVLTNPNGRDVAEDAVVFTVVDAHLQAYRPQTEGPGYGQPFGRVPVPRLWDLPVGIRRNADDDDLNNVPDSLHSNVQDENDLIEVEIRGFPQFTVDQPFGVRLDVNTSMLNIWDSPDKMNSVAGKLLKSGSYWVEWVHSTSKAASPVTTSVIDMRNGNTALQSQTLFKPFESTVVVLTGEWQEPHDPRFNGSDHGIMRYAFEEYSNGYDVHLLDEDDVLPRFRRGAAFNEVVNAVNYRGVTQVSIMGYSHGGGSTYMLSEQLANTDLIVNPYSVPFTAYVDAIRQPLINFLPETRRPLRSNFHSNQYQTNDKLLHGAQGTGDDELDRSSLGVNHVTIDDHAMVIELLKDRLESKVQR